MGIKYQRKHKIISFLILNCIVVLDTVSIIFIKELIFSPSVRISFISKYLPKG